MQKILFRDPFPNETLGDFLAMMAELAAHNRGRIIVGVLNGMIYKLEAQA